MRDRDLEIQADARDKQREMEEIEEVLKKQLAGEPIETKKKRGNDLEVVKSFWCFYTNYKVVIFVHKMKKCFQGLAKTFIIS